jgi:drug/metabolite transporter (DMT)-like permease
MLLFLSMASLPFLANLSVSQLLTCVWYRMLIATLGLSLLFIFQRYSVKIALGDFIRIILVGFIVAAHWISFFGAIKLSNVSVTLGCLASATLFTSILEPLLLKRGINLIEVLIGFLIILGLYLIFRFETNYATGIIVAIISAFLAGLFTVLNKILVQKHSTRILTIYEMMGGFIGISIFLLLTGGFSQSFFILPTSDIVYLLILGLICTAFAFAIQVDVMKELSAFIVALSINLEPVYGIIMAFIFFGETEFMSAGFYAGTALILVSVFGYPLMKNMQR